MGSVLSVLPPPTTLKSQPKSILDTMEGIGTGGKFWPEPWDSTMEIYPKAQTVHVPHLGGIDAGYYMPQEIDLSKPTLILINSFFTTFWLYEPQLVDAELKSAMNLLVIEPLGHGQTRSRGETFTYWDTAIMSLQVMEALGVAEAFVLGANQGGWIATRMALLEPDKIKGIIPIGTSMDSESPRSRTLGCWDAIGPCTSIIGESPNRWSPGDKVFSYCSSIALGGDFGGGQRSLLVQYTAANYTDDAGWQRTRMSTINLRDRDGLHGRLFAVTCPVLWLHGTSDDIYSVANALEEILMFTNSSDTQLLIVPNGKHLLNVSHPKQVNRAVADFVSRLRKG